MSQRLSVIPARAIEDDRLSKGDLKVLNALGVYADKDGWSFPSQQTLADKINMTRMSVSRGIKKLCDYGYIASENNYRENGSQSSNKYRVLFDLPPLIHNGESSGCNINVQSPTATEMLHPDFDNHNKNVTPPKPLDSTGCNIYVSANNGESSGCNINVVSGVTRNVTPITTQEELIDDCNARGAVDKNSVQEIFQWLEKHFNSSGVFYKPAPIEAWLSWGADFEKDIKPAAILYSKKNSTPPRCLSWLRDLIHTSIRLRTEPMPEAGDIAAIFPKPPKKQYLSPDVYRNIKKKITDGHVFVSDQEKGFVREFEKQELGKIAP